MLLSARPLFPTLLLSFTPCSHSIERLIKRVLSCVLHSYRYSPPGGSSHTDPLVSSLQTSATSFSKSSKKEVWWKNVGIRFRRVEHVLNVYSFWHSNENVDRMIQQILLFHSHSGTMHVKYPYSSKSPCGLSELGVNLIGIGVSRAWGVCVVFSWSGHFLSEKNRERFMKKTSMYYLRNFWR